MFDQNGSNVSLKAGDRIKWSKKDGTIAFCDAGGRPYYFEKTTIGEGKLSRPVTMMAEDKCRLAVSSVHNFIGFCQILAAALNLECKMEKRDVNGDMFICGLVKQTEIRKNKPV